MLSFGSAWVSPFLPTGLTQALLIKVQLIGLVIVLVLARATDTVPSRDTGADGSEADKHTDVLALGVNQHEYSSDNKAGNEQ